MEFLRRRPPRSALVFFGLAALCAGAAIVLMGAWQRQVVATRPDVGEPTPVVVAAADLIRGTQLADAMLEIRQVPASLVPPGAVEQVEDAIGQTLVADIAVGEAITTTRIGSAGSGPIAALVPAGLRAFVLHSGVPEGTLRSGDVVDVLATFGAGGGRPYTDTVATDIQVLRVLVTPEGLTASVDEAGVAVVVLADPETVEVLARASALGIITISIAGPETAGFPGGAVGEASPTPGYLDG